MGGFLSAPDPVSIFESAKTAGLERQAANSAFSAAYSAWLAFTWRAGDSTIAKFLGVGQALKDAALAAYLSLRELERKNFLTLTVPKDLLDADQSRFQTEQIVK